VLRVAGHGPGRQVEDVLRMAGVQEAPDAFTATPAYSPIYATAEAMI
jgi:hypothetical protein